MRALIQRVTKASVTINHQLYSSVNQGLLVFVGIEDSDEAEDIEWLSNKIVNLRIFNDENTIMNLSVRDISGEIMVISQFTLHASTKKGNRPSYIRASKPSIANPLYDSFVHSLIHNSGLKIKNGQFGADMKIDLVNDGPVTIFIDTKNKE
jgi:D-tyrosyl-tRNA(Tyr) deacylase